MFDDLWARLKSDKVVLYLYYYFKEGCLVNTAGSEAIRGGTMFSPSTQYAIKAVRDAGL
jgi:hypothetical protein